jgi:hypothetical protein
LEEERKEGARGVKIFSYLILHYTIPRATGTTECTGRWNSSDNDKFPGLIAKGKTDIDNITPKFIKSIRTKHCWENRTATNFCQNYRRVVNTLRLALDLNGARVE